jgi:hypothetical protein
LTNLLGKILRINSNGTIPTDNPFFNTASGVNRAIWALGLRNPFSFGFQPGTGRMLINDVGEASWEEINDGIAGSNYGWPATEGQTTDPRFRSPLFAYAHGGTSTTGCAIVGSAFYNPATLRFPAEYTGTYFFADLCSGWIRRFSLANNTVADFASGISNPVDLAVTSDGSLYYLARGTGALYRVQYTATQPPVGLGFVPLTPCRVVDTRNSTGPFGGPAVAGGTSRDFPVPSGVCGVPPTAQAYSFNVAVVPRGFLGYLSIWPAGVPKPVVSTLNSLDGRIKAVGAIVPAGAGGSVSVYATNTTDVVLDINGYFVPGATAGAAGFFPVTPCRVLDTRGPTGPLAGPALAGGVTRSLPILSSACNLPSSAQAYSLNFTVVPRGTLGFLAAWPGGQSQPPVSVLNAPTGTVTANHAIVPAGVSGSINVIATHDTDLVIDVNGYFSSVGGGGHSFFALHPCRAVDTRFTPGPLGAPSLSGQRNFNISSSHCGIPVDADAISLNATVVPHGFLGFLTLWPAGVTWPGVSTLNSLDGTIVSNGALVPATGGTITALSTHTTDLILDVNGYFR